MGHAENQKLFSLFSPLLEARDTSIIYSFCKEVIDIERLFWRIKKCEENILFKI